MVNHVQCPCLWWTRLFQLPGFAVDVVVGTTHLQIANSSLLLATMCGKVGHIAPSCRSKKKSPKKAQWVVSSEPSTPTTASPEEPLYVIQKHSSPPYRVQLQVQGRHLLWRWTLGQLCLLPQSQQWLLSSLLLSCCPRLSSRKF